MELKSQRLGSLFGRIYLMVESSILFSLAKSWLRQLKQLPIEDG